MVWVESQVTRKDMWTLRKKHVNGVIIEVLLREPHCSSIYRRHRNEKSDSPSTDNKPTIHIHTKNTCQRTQTNTCCTRGSKNKPLLHFQTAATDVPHSTGGIKSQNNDTALSYIYFMQITAVINVGRSDD